MTDTTPATWRSIPALAERINDGAKHKTFSEHSIRHYVRNADNNGLAPHVRRLGRKVLVDEAGFRAWLDRAPTGRLHNACTPQKSKAPEERRLQGGEGQANIRITEPDEEAWLKRKQDRAEATGRAA